MENASYVRADADFEPFRDDDDEGYDDYDDLDADFEPDDMDARADAYEAQYGW